MNGEKFQLTVEDTFQIRDYCLTIVGFVDSGMINEDDFVIFQDAFGEFKLAQVIGIENYRSAIKLATKGTAVGLLLDGVSLSDISTGDVLLRADENSELLLTEDLNSSVRLTEGERKYFYKYREYLSNHMMSQEDRKLLDRYAIKNGVSIARTIELEKILLTANEKTYMHDYHNCLMKGYISNSDRVRLADWRALFEIPDWRAQILEEVVSQTPHY